MEEVYQKINELAEALKCSEQLNVLRNSKIKIEADAELSELLDQYLHKQYEIQKRQLLNKDINEEMVDDLTIVYQQIQTKPDILDFLDSQYVFVQMWADLQRIVGDVIGDIFDTDERMLN